MVVSNKRPVSTNGNGHHEEPNLMAAVYKALAIDHKSEADRLRKLYSLDHASARQKLEMAAQLIFSAIGENPDREGLRDTPRRFADVFLEDISKNMKPEDELSFQMVDEKYGGIIIVRGIPIHAWCEHHILPFRGYATIGYIPNKKLTGLSKLSRLATACSKGLAVQERITDSIADSLFEILQPKGVAVVIECQHSCMMDRGVMNERSTAITSSIRGVFLTDEKARAEFNMLLSHNKAL